MNSGTGPGAAARFMARLSGFWEGTGEGDYPTIEPFRYREVLRFTPHARSPILHYEQQTWRLTADGEVPSHWETGYLRTLADGTIELLDAQESGRTEILRGTPVESGHGWDLSLESVEIVGDSRMVSSARTLRLQGESLEYEMWMTTDRVSPAVIHLRASLARRQEASRDSATES